MKSLFIKRFIILNLVILLLFTFNNAQEIQTFNVSTSKDSKADVQKKAIENIVRDYLLKNPEIIREAMQALQIKETKELQERIAANIKKFENEIFFNANTPTVGNKKAKVSIVAFFDYNCGYCKQSLPALKELLAEDKSIRVVYKEYPIMGLSSQLAAKAALAAQKQGKYTEFHDALVIAEQINEESIKNISKSLNLNYEQLQKDMNDEKINQYLLNNYNLASSLNIEGTPAYIIGTQFIPGAIDANSLKQLVEIEKAKLSETAKAKANSTAK